MRGRRRERAGPAPDTQAQLRAFQGALEALAARGIALPKAHALASAGVLAQPECAGDWARVGLALYGVPPAFARAAGAGLRPVLSLKARVALVRTLRAGECAGYGLAFSAARESRLAVLSIGYADGLPRALSCGAGCALVRGPARADCGAHLHGPNAPGR